MSVQKTSVYLSAIHEARKFVGATSPNPPVGAVVLDARGNLLSVGAHQKSGQPHAEVMAIQACKDAGLIDQAYEIFVTLEPCNHTGRTGPCTQAILSTPIRKVTIGCKDPNPHVAGGGAEFLKEHGIQVEAHILENECLALAEGFFSLMTNKRPFVTIKRAFNESGSMIPTNGQKTFTSPNSLRLAHELRREADAIVTGSGTILADQPLFTVRHVQDFKDKRRFLVVLDRRLRVPRAFDDDAAKRGLDVLRPSSWERAVQELSEKQCLKVLVEAGPQLTSAILDSGVWDRCVQIYKGSPDRVVINNKE